MIDEHHIQHLKRMTLGAATSSYQIEGSVHRDGAGESNWTRFCRIPGKVVRQENGDHACNHYTLWKDDIRLMQELGLQSYRFSISWARIFPDSSGRPNYAGIEHYRRLTKALSEAGIEPMVTLYHWDLPQWLEDEGGWSSPAMVMHFSRYARVMTEALSPWCSKWLTLNEPWVFFHKGFITGEHAPGYTDLNFAAKAYPVMLQAHAEAVRVMRAAAPGIQVGVTCNVTHVEPVSDDPADVAAANLHHRYVNELFLDPWILGRLPDVAFDTFGACLPEHWRTGCEDIKEPMDFIGLNYYTRTRIAHDPDAFLNGRAVPGDRPVTTMGWEFYPEGLHSLLLWTSRRHGLPVYITENGAALDDVPAPDGRVYDPERARYFEQHLMACEQAAEAGADIRGYYAWSLLDNFEWELGYDKRFGLIYVDFESGKRIIKESGYFYRDFIQMVTQPVPSPAST